MTGEPVYFAENSREADRLEEVLDAAGVSYTLRLDAMPREGGACFQGIMYEVSPENAERCRRLLLDRGLSRGIVASRG